MDERALYDLACVELRCPRCGGRTRQIDKDTTSGRDMREYGCEACGWNHVFDLGEALWKTMSDAKSRASGE
ncbi:MAG: hypothetical protein ABR863_08205 [Roseiarcus sp.]|jgi:predicted RNA-binding Zn-ribbon protein involved in translation (DUF1610 family)